MKDHSSRKATIRFVAFFLPLLFLALLLLGISMFWEEHDPSAPHAQTETESETPPATEAQTETREPQTEEQSYESQAQALASLMTLEEKVAQLFFLTPEALTGVDSVTAAGPSTEAAYQDYPVGGIIYFSQNIYSEEQFKEMTFNMKRISENRIGVPAFLGIDEEGGTVARLANHESLSVENVGPMLEIGNGGDSKKAYEAGKAIGEYLKEFGLNLDFAPVADVLDSRENTVIGDRSFGTEPAAVAEMTAQAVKGIQEAQVSGTLKHFPGHGSTAEDTHTSYAYNNKTLEELEQSDFLPFEAGIEAGADLVMVGHLAAPNAAGEDIPAIFSKTLVTEILRNQMGFEGVVITDALNMEAVQANYPAKDAAVRAIEAGVDMLLMPSDFQSAYQGVLSAVADGTLTEGRIDESVIRILALKYRRQQG